MTKKPVYMAVVLHDHSSSSKTTTTNDDHLVEPLLLTTPTATTKSTSTQAAAAKGKQLCYFVLGALVGVIFALLGFDLQSGQPWLSNNDNAYRGILLYSLCWSCTTSAVAYGLFWLLAMPNHAEYLYALGVFLGFCSACTVVDVVVGLPWPHVMWTVLVAALWSIIMMHCGRNNNDDDQTDGEEEEKQQNRRSATVLPLVMV